MFEPPHRSTSGVPGVRFRPPRVTASPTLSWLLLRAFAPAGIASPQPSPGEALALARRLGLASRIASRQEAALLRSELGEEEAGAFSRRRAATAAGALRLRASAGEVVRVASAEGIPLVFLKGFALEVGGWLDVGSRPAADLDLLAPEQEVERLQEALLAAGFRAGPTGDMEHQLAPLVAPAGGVIEVHRCLLGVRPAGSRRSATLAVLAAAGRLVEAPGWEGCRLPDRSLLLAHAAVHGLVQHGFSPDAYVALRLVADWIDLGAAELEGEEWRGLSALVAAVLSPAELGGLLALSNRLSKGDLAPLSEPPSGSPEATLLHHCLAGTLDESYASTLKLEMLAHPLSDLAPLRARWRAVRNAVFPSAADLEVLYGGAAGPLPGGGLGPRLGRRLWRPVDLVIRTLRHSVRVLVGPRGGQLPRG